MRRHFKARSAPGTVASLTVLTVLGWPLPATAHSFGQVYNLPVPFWLYAWGAGAALAASFLVAAVCMTSHATAGHRQRRIDDWRGIRLLRRMRLGTLARLIAVALLGLCIATGVFGSQQPYGNFNMTFFWIVYTLGLTYCVALAGNLDAIVNPWWALASWLAQLWPAYGHGWLTYPARAGHWPAVLLYIGFIWVELFGGTDPASLAHWLAGYTVFNLIGVGVFGINNWFRHVELFAVFFRVVGRMGVLDIHPRAAGLRPIALRPPGAGLLAPAAGWAMLVFILFMAASTAFDGLKVTLAWHRLFWVDAYHAGLKDIAGTNPLAAYPHMTRWFRWFNTACLMLAPALYFGVYMVFIALMRALTRQPPSLRTLALAFGPSLLPIALAYHFTHYYTLLQTQGVKIVRLASDPFGFGWDLLGTGDWLARTIIPNAGTVWHVQVIGIVIGHVISVIIAHRVALAMFGNRRDAVISQIPMLGLMIALTVGGLWILSQPLA